MVKGEGIDPANFEMMIFDRWGERIFKSTDLNTGWNGAKNNVGELVQEDAYVLQRYIDCRAVCHTAHMPQHAGSAYFLGDIFQVTVEHRQRW